MELRKKGGIKLAAIKNLIPNDPLATEHRHHFNLFKMPFGKLPLVGGEKTANLTARACLCGAVRITGADWNNVALIAKEAILEIVEIRLRQMTKRKTIKAFILLKGGKKNGLFRNRN